MAFNLLTDVALTSAHSVTGSWADVTGMSDTVSIAGPNSIVILAMSLQHIMGSGDRSAEYRFTEGGSRVGPEVTSYSDGSGNGDGRTLIHAVTGLSAGNHTFAVQGQVRTGTVDIDTNYVRTFQIIEITSGATLLVDLETSAADTAPASFANMANLSASATPGSAASVLLHLHGSQILDDDDYVSEHRFAVDGTRRGPRAGQATDTNDETTGLAMAFAETGVSAASHTFSVQWEIVTGSPVMDTGRPRTYQVIEIDANADLLVDLSSLTGNSAPASYADQPGMSGSPDIDSVDSIALTLANWTPRGTDNDSADNRLAIGGTQEGAEMTVWSDDPEAGEDRASHCLMARGVTGESGVTTFANQWQQRSGTAETSTRRERTFQVIDLKAVAVVHTASGAPEITKPTSTGSAIRKITSDGAPSIAKPTSTGTARRIIKASGAPEIKKPVSAGNAIILPPTSDARRYSTEDRVKQLLEQDDEETLAIVVAATYAILDDE